MPHVNVNARSWARKDRGMLKLLHNKHIPKYFLAFVGIVIALYFALNAYPVGEWIGIHFLHFAGGPQLLGIVCALFIGVCVLLLFFHKEYMKQAMTAYSQASNDYSFERAFKWFVVFVMCLEFCSVAFRWIQLNGSSLGWVLLALGIVGMCLTAILGKVLHGMVNVPPSVAAYHLRNEAGRQVFEDSEKHLKGLSIAQKRQVYIGNPQPIDDVRDEKAREREREVKASEERRRIAEEEQAKNDEFYQKMTSPAGQNGHGGKPHF
jgi:signal transduction histidine kinase